MSTITQCTTVCCELGKCSRVFSRSLSPACLLGWLAGCSLACLLACTRTHSLARSLDGWLACLLGGWLEGNLWDMVTTMRTTVVAAADDDRGQQEERRKAEWYAFLAQLITETVACLAASLPACLLARSQPTRLRDGTDRRRIQSGEDTLDPLAAVAGVEAPRRDLETHEPEARSQPSRNTDTQTERRTYEQTDG